MSTDIACLVDALTSIAESQASIAGSLKRIASGPTARDREDRAISLLVEHGPNVRAIARELGVDEKALRKNYSRFMSLAKSLRGERERERDWKRKCTCGAADDET